MLIGTRTVLVVYNVEKFRGMLFACINRQLVKPSQSYLGAQRFGVRVTLEWTKRT